MSKSLARVQAVLADAGLENRVLEMPGETRTAAQAAAAAGCDIHQIVKSIIFRGETSGAALLFLTAGGDRIDPAKASDVAGEPLGKADAALVRGQTGFAIGGVAPIGHLHPIRAFFDPTLLSFEIVWAAAGTPRHIFPVAPTDLLHLSDATLADFTV